VWTLGHSNQPLEESLELLWIHRLERVIDGRRFPSSRQRPWPPWGSVTSTGWTWAGGALHGRTPLTLPGGRRGRADMRGAVPLTLPPAAHRRCPDGAGIPGGAPPGSRALRPAFASSVGAAGGETADLRRISRAMGNAGSSVLGRLRGATWSPGDLQGGGRVFPWTKRGALLIVCESRLA
jgi:hypothetical protein